MFNIQHEQISFQGCILLKHKSPHAWPPKPQITTCTDWERRGNVKLQLLKRLRRHYVADLALWQAPGGILSNYVARCR